MSDGEYGSPQISASPPDIKSLCSSVDPDRHPAAKMNMGASRSAADSMFHLELITLMASGIESSDLSRLLCFRQSSARPQNGSTAPPKIVPTISRSFPGATRHQPTGRRFAQRAQDAVSAIPDSKS